MGRESSGNPFNSLLQLEKEEGVPRNPFINAGALVVTDAIYEVDSNAKESVLEIVRALSGASDINFDMDVADSERAHGCRNRAMANFMKSFGTTVNDVDLIVDAYFHHCSIVMGCEELATACSFLAAGGVDKDGERVLSASKAKKVKALMLTYGTYDAAGVLAYSVGLPCKSGVGGGIVAAMPGEFSLCVWAPGLGRNRNSYVGLRALELLTTETGVSIF